jgi:PAS domain S-box-containing protein
MEEHDSPQQELRAKIRRLEARVAELEQDRHHPEDHDDGEDARRCRLSAAMEQSSIAVVLLDLTGVILEANQATRNLFDTDHAADLIGKNSFDIVAKEDFEKASRDMITLLEEGHIKGVETRFVNRAGEVLLLELNMSIITNGDSAPSGIVGVLRDLTAQRKMEDELLKARKLESIGLLAGGIAHDFNNVLSAILGNLNVARARCDPDANVLPLLVDAEKATLRARKLTQRLLTFAQGGEPIKSTARISKLLDEAMGTVSLQDAQRPTVEISEGLWKVFVDRGQIRQALEHLLSNALSASGPDGAVAIRACNVQIAIGNGALLPGCYVQLAFEDSGPSIPPERRADVFDPYFGTKGTDSALALATAFSIASRHGGTITVDSAPGAGRVFAICLPASLSPTQERALQTTRIAGEGRRILVMDDEPMVSQVAGRMLETLGFEVTLTADGEEAIARFEQARAESKPFHAVMLDLTVPGGLGGRETVARLRVIDPEVRAIVASGYSSDAVMANFADHGFNAVLAKPFQLAELADALHRTL